MYTLVEIEGVELGRRASKKAQKAAPEEAPGPEDIGVPEAAAQPDAAAQPEAAAEPEDGTTSS